MALQNNLDKIVTSDFTITPKVSLPITSLSDGRLDVKNGILYIYDSTRAKWLSVNRKTLTFGREGTTNDQYLNLSGGVVSSTTGYRLIQNMTIVSMSVQTSNIDTYSINIRKNDDETNLATLNVTGTQGAGITTTNVNLDVTDYLQCYLDYTGIDVGVNDPIVIIELAWRT